MAKGQKRSSREPKKLKTSKKKHEGPSYLAGETGNHSVIKVVPESNAAKR